MHWNLTTRYRILLEINNAVITNTSRDDFFKALSKELKKHFKYDRLSIFLYEKETKFLRYFSVAEGVQPEGFSTNCATGGQRRHCQHGDSFPAAGYNRRFNPLCRPFVHWIHGKGRSDLYHGISLDCAKSNSGDVPHFIQKTPESPIGIDRNTGRRVQADRHCR